MERKFNFDQILDRTRERSKTWDFRTLKPGALPMNGAETHYACPIPVREAVKAVADWPIYGYPYFTEEFVNAAAGYQKRRRGSSLWVGLDPASPSSSRQSPKWATRCS